MRIYSAQPLSRAYDVNAPVVLTVLVLDLLPRGLHGPLAVAVAGSRVPARHDDAAVEGVHLGDGGVPVGREERDAAEHERQPSAERARAHDARIPAHVVDGSLLLTRNSSWCKSNCLRMR